MEEAVNATIQNLLNVMQVKAEITSECTDWNLLEDGINGSKAALGVETLEGIADRGYSIWNTVIKCAVIWDGAKDKTKYEEVQNDEKMIAYCGLDRGKCDAYLATVRDDQALRKKPQKHGQS